MPIGYSSTAIGPKPSDSLVASKSGPTIPSLTYILVAISAVTVGVVVSGLFFHFKTRKKAPEIPPF